MSDPPPSRPEESRIDRLARMRADCLEHLDAIYRGALRLTGNRLDAEDLVQETYLKAVRNVDRYRGESGCKPWLFRILTNTYIDLYRKIRGRPREVEYDDEGATGIYDRIVSAFPADGTEGPLHSPDGLDGFLHRFMGDEVKAAIESLPEDFRALIVLRDLEGLSYRECAEALDIPVGTVMSRLYRGRRGLQEKLWEYAVDHGYVTETAARRDRP